MKTLVHLLRGINVGGHKKIPMAVLRECYASIGLKNVKTYIQSGNAVFQTDGTISTGDLEKVILDKTTFEVPTMLFSAEEWQEVKSDMDVAFAKLPEDHKAYITLLEKEPSTSEVEVIKEKLTPEEELSFSGRALFLSYPKTLAKPYFNNNVIEKLLNQRATTRNQNTVNALMRMVDEMG